MSDHSELRELAALLALGVLPPRQRRRIEAHLARGCARCEDALRSAREVAEALLSAPKPVPPGRRLRARVLASAARRGPSGSRPRS